VKPLIVIPAAGASSRMRGRDKLLEPINGTPLLRRQTQAAIATGCPVVVTLPPNNPARETALENLSAKLETVPEADEGMAASLRHAQALLAPHQPLALLLPDVPGITTTDILAVLARFQKTGQTRITRASEQDTDRPGTPLFLPNAIAKRLADLTGDSGGRGVLRGEPVDLVRFADDRATRDLDTPEDWKAWRRANNTPT